jgi:hypothetical protein
LQRSMRFCCSTSGTRKPPEHSGVELFKRLPRMPASTYQCSEQAMVSLQRRSLTAKSALIIQASSRLEKLPTRSPSRKRTPAQGGNQIATPNGIYIPRTQGSPHSTRTPGPLYELERSSVRFCLPHPGRLSKRSIVDSCGASVRESLELRSVFRRAKFTVVGLESIWMLPIKSPECVG